MIDPGMATPATRLEIDLDAVAANWRTLAARHAGGETAAVVKADGYGLGAIPVATRLRREGCRHFFIATVDEAAALRPHLPGALLYALNGLYQGEAATYAALDLIPALGSLGEIAAWRAAARQLGRALPAVLHVDTGMNRLGLPRDELARLAAEPALLDGLDLRYVMTHLIASDNPAAPENAAQLARFTAARAALPPMPSSLDNSSGRFLGHAYASDLARPGAALYGINPTPGRPNPMRQVVRLSARVLQIRDIAADETVGYDATWRAARPSRIATVGVGYADGFPRAASNRGEARFDGVPVPLVGRVSMDLTTYDVTDLPALRVGDFLDLLGPENPPDALAAVANTIGYEILTSLGPRYHRIWLGQ